MPTPDPSDPSASALSDLLHHPDVWRAGRRLDAQPATIGSGHPALDPLLAGHGWPRAGLIELLLDQLGVGELRLLAPALTSLGGEPRWLAWINPPHIPYAPALSALGIDIRKVLLVHPRQHQDALWTLERALRSGTCSAVLAWLDESRLRMPEIRRLKLAAREGNTLAVLFRPLAAAVQPSMAELRIGLKAAADGESLILDVLKRRGAWPTTLQLDLPRVALIDRATVADQLTAWRAKWRDQWHEQRREVWRAHHAHRTTVRTPSPRPLVEQADPRSKPAVPIRSSSRTLELH